jgi:ATP-dependent DNA helicase RecG
MEQRGSGFARMREAMLNHGLDEPKIEQQDGFFVVTLPGPAGNYDRIKTPENAGGLVTPATESQLNERQKKMVVLLASGEELTSRRCEVEFGVTRPVTAKDFGALVNLGVAQKVGSGRSTRYRLKPGPIVK